MADAEIGALRVSMALNAADFEKGARSAGEAAGGLGEKLRELGAKVTSWSFVMKAAMAVAAIVSVENLRQIINAMDEVSKTANKIRLPVNQFLEFKHAAEVVGVPVSSLESGLQKLSDTLEEVGRGDAEEAGKTFTALGVTIKDSGGQVRQTADVFRDLSTKFAGFEDSAAKTTLATNLFGGSAEALIPLLNRGGASLAQSAAEARSFGLVIDGTTAKAAERLNENLRTLWSMLKGITFAADIVPMLADFSRWLVETARSAKLVETVGAALSTVLRGIGAAAMLVSSGIQIVAVVFRDVGSVASAAFSMIPLAMELAMKGTVNAAISGMESVVNTIVTGLAKVGGAADSITGGNLGEKITQSLTIDVGRMRTEEATKNLEDISGKLSALTAKGDAEIEKLATSGWQSAQAIMGGWTASIEEASVRIPKAQAPIIESDKMSAEAKAELNRKIHEGIQLAKQMETPRETELRHLESLRLAYDKGKISAEALGRAQQAAAYTAQAAYAGLASNVMGSLSKLFEGSKAVAIASALVNTYESVTKALAAYPPPLSFIAAGAALAAGLAQVMNITQTTKGSAGGGGGASPSAAAASSSAAMGSEAGGAASPQMMMVKGLNPGQLFTGESVRDLAGQLLKFQKDGGEVVLA